MSEPVNTLDLTGKVLLVTGASSGIGRSTVNLLASCGAVVVAVSRSGTPSTPTSVDGAFRAGAVTWRPADVTSQASLDAVAAEVRAACGGLDGFFANAGVLHGATLVETTDEQWDATMAVNLTGVWRTFKAFVPLMEGRPSGSVVVNSSVNGRRAAGGWGAYSASKFGVLGLAQTLAMEIGPQGHRVNSVLPTSVDTPMINGVEHRSRMTGGGAEVEDQLELYRAGHVLPVGWIEAADVARAVAWLLSDQTKQLTGVELPIDAGYGIKGAPLGVS